MTTTKVTREGEVKKLRYNEKQLKKKTTDWQ